MLKQKLKDALKLAGLSEGLADFISITEESQIEGVITSLKSTQNPDDVTPDFNKILGSEEFAKYISKTGFEKVIELSKPLKSGHDKKVTEGIKNNQEKYFKQINPENKEEMNEDGTPKTPKKDDDMPAWAKTLMDKVEGIEKSKTTESKLEQAKASLKGSKIISEKLQERWVSRIDLESDKSFEDQVKELETEYTETYTAAVGGASGKGLPLGGQNTGEASDSEVEEIFG
ncbi:MAG: hypothetical protein V3V28_09330 [Polaribacter sp.]|uniref:hypothetical protein n=1 Tax=Polaribacter sp. TaxID=1920175 RepID=UPI002F34FF28